EWETIRRALSHDLQAPLRGISSLGKILLEEHAPALTDEASALAQLMAMEAANAGRMLEGLLLWCRCHNEPLALAWEDPAGIARAELATIKSARPGQRIELELSPIPRVWSDLRVLSQIFRELLSNAAKFSQVRPVSIITITAQDDSHETVITVRDNGVGFDM